MIRQIPDLQLPGELTPEWVLAISWVALATGALRILVALIVAWIAFWVLRVLTRRLEVSAAAGDDATARARQQRTRTLVGLVRSVGVGVIVVITLFSILGILGHDIRPLLAGAGVVGLAISFGAQSLVRDVITGMFMLFENQFGVGDVIRIGDTGGVVERLTLRVVVLRDVHGAVHIIPNGEIKMVTNLTRSWSRAVLEVGVAYRENIDRVMDVMRSVGREMWEDDEWRPLLVEELTVPGIESFGESAVNIRIMAKTLPLKQWDVARELRRRLKNRFDAEGIEIPFPHRTVFWGEGQMPASAEEASGVHEASTIRSVGDRGPRDAR